ncbi:chaperone DNAJ protein, putative [Trypanosoma cruzi marinkellei]|uniref:Chaperone DNAJ protein, putative n=1 Tax=Trypanosoma cruzi marinkellei TaxID=85056 RepID=K2NNT9_TRYCR|nr:chaperone DNAJ protein, putative [Trypanosoma cruzi marinkellei]
MDAHFRVLGLPRGCDEAALKKAYHQKALALHPDRNPGGTEQFKKVNEAYEALCVHFRRNGGHDSANISTATGVGADRPGTRPTSAFFTFRTHYTNAGSGFQYAKHQHSTEETTPFFTEEELFGSPPGGFTFDKRYSKAKYFSQTGNKKANNSNINGDYNNTSNNNKNEFNARSYGGGARFGTSQMYERADERWRRAHGDRVPVSGYSTQNGAAPPPSFPSVHQQSRQQPQQAPRTRPVPYSSSFAAEVNGGMDGRQPSEGVRSKARESNGDTRRQTQREGREGSRTYSHFTTDIDEDYADIFDHDNDNSNAEGDASTFASTSTPVNDILNEFETKQTLHEMRREWERLKKEMDRKMPGFSTTTRNPWDTKGGRDADEEEDYVVHERTPPMREDEAFQRHVREQQRLNEAHMRSIIGEKLQLKKVLFTQRYAPEPADVALMSDSDVFVLCVLLSEVGQRMQKVLNGRMLKGLCSRCSAAPKLQCNTIFTCGHTSVCAECALTCGVCPVCAAGRCS